MEQAAFEKYNKLSDKHLALMKAFEYYEKMHKGPDTIEEASSEYRSLLQFWRDYLGVSFCTPANEENGPNQTKLVPQLEIIDDELLKIYSPVEMPKERIEEYYCQLLGYLSTMSDDAILAEKAVFLLSRLLYNILLVRDCYYPIYSLPYIDFLNNLKNRLNLCIIVSQLDYFSEYFEEIVGDFNKDFISVREVTPHILSIVGGLNFKCHKYAEAISIFKKAISSYEALSFSNLVANDEYFATKLLLAYCYEYNHEFEASIQELIGVDVSKLFALCGEFRIYNLVDESSYREGEKNAQQIVKRIRSLSEEAGNNNLLALGLLRDHEIDPAETIGDAHEVLHSLAHCLNELGIKNKTEGKRDNIVKLLFLARMIMLLVAEQNADCEDFQTCLYMIYGEAKDYDMCLGRIRAITKKLHEQPYKNANYYMENTFYRFLVLNQSNRVSSDECAAEAKAAYDEFKKFARRRYDYDALIHIEIIKFRSSIINILREQTDASLLLKGLQELKESDEGKNMFGIVPSAKLNKWIVQEYNKTIALYEFLIKYFESSGSDINALYNYACRFSFFRNLFEENVHSFSDHISKEDAIQQTLELIIEDVLSPQSIFLLAPLTSAVPYQHQTRSLLSLEKDLFLEKVDSATLTGKLENKIGSFQKLQEEIPQASEKSVALAEWLFTHEEYRTIFLISKNTPKQNCDRFYYRDKSGVSLERPIYNVQNVNQLLNKIYVKRRRRRHKICKNSHATCCISIIEEKSKDFADNSYRDVTTWIKNICADLLLPASVYENAHFVIDYRIAGGNIDWTIIGFAEMLSKVHESEIVSKLCGNGDQAPPEYRLAVSQENYCFVGFDPLAARYATTDLLHLQNSGFHFWFRQEQSDNEEEMLAKSKCALFYLSSNILDDTGNSRVIKLIKSAREIPMDSTNIGIIVTGYNTKASIKKALLAANVEESLIDNYILKSVVFRNSQLNSDKHMQQIGQVLKNNGVGKNAFC